MASQIVMARIGAPHGVKGDLKLQVFSEADLSAFSVLWIQFPKNNAHKNEYPDFTGALWEPMPAHKMFHRGQLSLIHFEGFDDRDLARKFTNALIGIDGGSLPEISSDREDSEFYWSALLGMRVVNLQGVDLGVVDRLFETGANDVMVLKQSHSDDPKQESKAKEKTKQKAKERLLPFVDAVVKSVDKNSRVISVDWDEDF